MSFFKKIIHRLPTDDSQITHSTVPPDEPSKDVPVDIQIIDSIEHVLRTERNETTESIKITLPGEDGLIDASVSSSSPDAKDITQSIDESHLNKTTDTEPTGNANTVDQPVVEKPALELNLTTDEIQIPVFSEWAQKRWEEEEEKEGSQDAIHLNTSTMRKNASSTKKQSAKMVKLKSLKNYASPDCGAKIIAANAEATSISNVLNNKKDEYLLSPCHSRVWFIVELCEALQAERVEIANLELFASSPRNFSVGVSSRFPTRDWTNVGRFLAQNARAVQSFDLRPHLFGKYLRVDIHSHYTGEHFCPVSALRVYGTSEFEAFETENSQAFDDLDLDDEDDLENSAVNSKSNIFKSASDAVMSIVDTVKKAASFVKPSDDKPAIKESSFSVFSRANDCATPNYVIHCDNCSTDTTNKVIALLQCKQQLLNRLIRVDVIRNSLYKSQLCANLVGLDFNVNCNSTNVTTSTAYKLNDKQMDYIAHLFEPTYVMAMCNLLAANIIRPAINTTIPNTAFNVTVDRQTETILPDVRTVTELPRDEEHGKQPELSTTSESVISPTMASSTTTTAKTDSNGLVNDADIEINGSAEQPEATISTTSTENTEEMDGDKSEQNIFNAPKEVPIVENTDTQPAVQADASEKTEIEPELVTPPTIIIVPEDSTTPPPPTTTTTTPPPPPSQVQQPPNELSDISEEQGVNSWQNVHQNGFAQKQHSESVFLRLSNRIKVSQYIPKY